MKIAVRYYSRSGNTRALAEAIAKAAGVQALSVDAPEAPIQEPVDLLFLGGALYAYGLDGHMKEYLKGLDRAKVQRAVIFSTSWLSKHGLDLLKKGLEEAGIPVEPESLYAKNKPNPAQLKAAENLVRKYL